MQNKKEQWTVLKRLMSYLKPYGLLTFLALSFLLATTVIKSVIPLVASHFIDQYLSNLNQIAVTVLLVYYGLYILQTLVQYVGNLLFVRVSYSIVRDIRRDAFANSQATIVSEEHATSPFGLVIHSNAPVQVEEKDLRLAFAKLWEGKKEEPVKTSFWKKWFG